MTEAHPENDPGRFLLATLPGMGASSWKRLEEAIGPPSAVLQASGEELLNSGIRPDLAREILSAQARLDETGELLGDCLTAGIQIFYPESEGVPLRLISATPDWHILTLLGDPGLLDATTVIGMVGRRQATEVGVQLAFDLAAGLAGEGVAVLSGMAQGIDQSSHVGCLSEGGSTIAVLPMGIMRFLRENRRWRLIQDALEAGKLLLISGAHPLQKWDVSEAMRRNGWIAAWSDVLVVVEAGTQGGTWKTARSARKKGKQVLVFTGFDGNEAGVGNSNLIRSLSATPLDAGLTVSELVGRILQVAADSFDICRDKLLD